MGSLSGKKVAFIIAPSDFRDEEYFRPKVVLQSVGAAISTAAIGDPNEVVGTQGGKAHTDTPFSDIRPELYDGIIFVGGSGSRIYFSNPQVLDLVRAFDYLHKPIGAICSAVGILAHAGILMGKSVTSFEEEKDTVERLGGIWQTQPAVIDGSIVTAHGPESALAFGDSFEKVLSQV